MLNFIKKNKILSILIMFSIISVILGILFNAVLSEDNKVVITDNINKLIEGNFIGYDTLTRHLFATIFIWILGISLIGFIFIFFVYLFNLFIVSFETCSLFINLGFKNIILIILYLVPNIIYLITLFVFCLYSISYSLCLFRFLFRGREYNLKLITKRYLKVFIICFIFVIISNVLEFIILPRLNVVKI